MSRHLIHIGFPKAGSTALQAWFAGHPRMTYVADGIGGYRDVEELASAAVIRSDLGR